LQILPFHAKHTAQLRKLVGYFLWHGHPIRIAHSTLTTDHSQGGLNLKNFQLQGLALRINRALQLVCYYTHSFSYEFLQNILRHIDTVAPLDVQRWRYYNPFFEDVYIHLSYFIIAQTPLDTFTTKTLYQYLQRHTDRNIPNIAQHYPHYDWPLIFNNIHFIQQYAIGYDTWYRIIHNIFPTNARLHELEITPHDQCIRCQTTDDLFHRFTVCPPLNIIWKSYQYMVAVLLHTSPSHITFDHMIRFPEYRYYPPHKKKFLLWLTTQTLEIALHTKDLSTAECYPRMLQYRLWQEPEEIIHAKFNRFYRVLYMTPHK
jgi:hypothetical protein